MCVRFWNERTKEGDEAKGPAGLGAREKMGQKNRGFGPGKGKKRRKRRWPAAGLWKRECGPRRKRKEKGEMGWSARERTGLVWPGPNETERGEADRAG